MIYIFLIMILSVAVDQVTKHLAITHLADIGSYPVIPNILHFTYVENRGAAFGLLANHRWVFMIFSSVAIVLILVWLLRDKTMGPWLRTAGALIVGGGIGNMIDRLFIGYVVDFIDFVCIRFYVFNVADSCVCVGCAMFVLGVLRMEYLESKRKKALAAGTEESAGPRQPNVTGKTDADGPDCEEQKADAAGKEQGDEPHE